GRFVSGEWPPCDPESFTYIACETLGPFNLNAPGRVLVVAAVTASTEVDSEEFSGTCRLNINGVSYENTTTAFHGYGEFALHNGTLVTVTGVLSGGNNYITLECFQGSDGAIQFTSERIAAVSLSGN
ncbi:MAG: hypothetical protein M3285_04655, partial [Actinomycetota bacterium]|nr:hypothetical protein [Actinomycetota bacterium]